MPLLIDAHLDLAWNALSFDRDLTEAIAQINAQESGMTDSRARGNATVSIPELRRGKLAVCLATLLVHARPDLRPTEGHKRISLDYCSLTAACAIARGQLAYYRLLEQANELVMVCSAKDLQAHWSRWESNLATTADPSEPVGYILAMEGADGIIAPSQTEEWFALGLRVAGLVHYGHNQYAHGTGEPGGLTKAGVTLLNSFRQHGIILDVTHLSDESFFEALNVFDGPILASHQNCRALVPGVRQFSDQQLRQLFERDSVIGIAFDNWMIVPDWTTCQTSRTKATLGAIVDHIDHICNLAGSHRHVAIGTDLDGGYGSEQCPIEIDSIADVQKLAGELERRGYSAPAITDIFHGNWLRFFHKYLPLTN